MARDPWWGMPVIMEGGYHRPQFLRVPKGTIIMARPVKRRKKLGQLFGNLGTIVWDPNNPKGSHDLVEWGTLGIYLGRRGCEVTVLIDGRMMLSTANRWSVVEPLKNVKRVSPRGVLLP